MSLPQLPSRARQQAILRQGYNWKLIVTPAQFIAKWKASSLKESSASQSHFIDLCELLGQQSPTNADPDGTWYCFEAGSAKTGGGDGWADVWKKGCFAWEYKGKHKDLNAAYAQLQRYAVALENPPLLIVSDMETIVIHTNWTNTVHAVIAIPLDALAAEDGLRNLTWAFSDPEQLKPGLTREELTKDAAREFATLASALHNRGFEPRRVAHFCNKLLFCMFAESIGILPPKLFTRMVETAVQKPKRLEKMAAGLFAAMMEGGTFGVDIIDWFDGGLFADSDVLPLTMEELWRLRRIARLDWSQVEPSIFGTLFERGLDPDKRSQLGAHYTDSRSIMRIVDPVVLAPLRDEWASVRNELAGLMDKFHQLVPKPNTPANVRVDWNLTPEERSLLRSAHKKPAVAIEANDLLTDAQTRCSTFLNRLANFRVLDPACGSGNFLYLALLGLKDLEHQVILEAERLGLPPILPTVGPRTVRGIELNAYAAELARVTIWIGQIQWMIRHGWGHDKDPVLQPLDQISCRDALLNDDGSEAEWPGVDCIVGNPPFLGDKKMISEMGEEYVAKLRNRYDGRVPGGADLVTYWFAKARQAIETGNAHRAGLVCTNSIRGGKNRKVLDDICETGNIFEAWSDEAWILDGAAVRVSIVCFASKPQGQARLDDCPVTEIYADLTGKSGNGDGIDLTVARRLQENMGVIFMGTTKVGAFNIPGETARKWLVEFGNPNRKNNSDVLKPWVNARDITKRPTDQWAVDFGTEMPEGEAALYQAPFEYLVRDVKAARVSNRRDVYARLWWLYGEPRPAMRKALQPLRRYIATPSVAKHRIFVFLASVVVPDHAVFAVCRDDDTTFGILHSRFHQEWTLRTCTWLGVGNDPRYTPTSTFETFPFPEGLTPNIPAAAYATDPRAIAIADAARSLNELREHWLNPPELVRREPEVVPGFPDRLIPVDAKAATVLKTRTLTNLYNQNPAWLQEAHRILDEAVAAAYGWPMDISEDEALKRLLELNLARNSTTS